MDRTALNAFTTEQEVCTTVGKTKIQKALGVDEIPSEVLKVDSLVKYMTTLFNYCFKKEIIPTLWKKSIIHPTSKSADKYPRLSLCFRGIGLTCHMYKVYCSVLQIKLYHFVDTNGLLVEEQNGFWKLRSSLDHIYEQLKCI